MSNETSSKIFSSVTVSLAAAIIPDTPIVSIAGSTLSEITTTTTSTKTTPTPVPTSIIDKQQQQHQQLPQSTKATNNATQIATNPMSEGTVKLTGTTAIATATGVGAEAVAASHNTIADDDNATAAAADDTTTTINANICNNNNNNNINNNSNNIFNNTNNINNNANFTSTTATAATVATVSNKALKKAITPPLLSTASTSSIQGDKFDETAKTKGSTEAGKDCINEWDDIRLKKLLEEAYSYKNPGDKVNKSKTFLELLEQAENEKDNPTILIRTTTSQGGSLQDLSFNAVGNESLDCDYNISVSGARNRRNNHNSRPKKYSSVSSRQREGGSCGSLPINVIGAHFNVLEPAHGAKFFGGGSSSNSSSAFCTIKAQRRNFDKLVDTVATTVKESKELLGTTATTTATAAAAANGTSSCSDTAAIKTACGGTVVGACVSSGDCVIEMDEPMMDIQQQQQILQTKGQDTNTTAVHYYDRLNNIDPHIPRASIVSSTESKFKATPTRTQCYVDENLRFTALDRSCGLVASANSSESNTINVNGGDCAAMSMLNSTGTVKDTAAGIDSKYLSLDENYKSCKSVLGEKTEMVKLQTPIFSGTKTIGRQFDENGNALHEMYPTGAHTTAATIFNSSPGSSINASMSTATNITQSQAKGKLKKKSQQERNTTTVDLRKVKGFCGELPVEQLVKYIENKDDKQNNNKKKERKKEKQLNNKLKKSNSLEELRSCSKIDVDDLKRTAATTESNVMMRNKNTSSNNNDKNTNKNNSLSTADINKNIDSNGKETVTVNKITTATNAMTQSRKGERRSWGTEELQYLGDSNHNFEEAKFKEKKGKSKEKDGAVTAIEGKEKVNIEKNDKNGNSDKSILCSVATTVLSTTSNTTATAVILTTSSAGSTTIKTDKLDKSEKRKKSESSAQSTASSATSLPATAALPTTTLPLTTAITNSNVPANAANIRASNNTNNNNNNNYNLSNYNSTNTATTTSTMDTVTTDTLVPETEEFHVVTKKKKPKKQRTAGDEANNIVTTTMAMNAMFNRTHNFINNMQKNTTFSLQQQQQQQIRYKYYNSNERTDYFSNYSHNNNSNNNSNYSHGNYQYHQHNNNQHQHQQNNPHHQHHSGNGDGVRSDKSRRKSTSSMPPSEKSDSSDLDSVHSLPIESTSKQRQQQQRNKNTTASASACVSISGVNTTPLSSLSGGSGVVGGCNGKSGSNGKNNNSPAPISYADIAAAAASSNSNANNMNAEKWPNVESANSGNNNSNPINDTTPNVNMSDDALSISVNATSSPANLNVSKTKAKKLAQKPDFPELVATTPSAPAAVTSSGASGGGVSTALTANALDCATTAGKITTSNAVKSAAGLKPISYSQRLTNAATTATTMPDTTNATTSATPVLSDASPSSIEAKDQRAEKRTNSNITETTRTDDANTSLPTAATAAPVAADNATCVGISRPHPSAQQQAPQPLQKSKSVEHESYNYNSSNMDQQYPALEKTVKRHSATNVAASTSATPFNQMTPSQTGLVALVGGQFNFAAAAKQQIGGSGGGGGSGSYDASVGNTKAATAAQTTPSPATAPASSSTTTTSNNCTMAAATPTAAAATTTVTASSSSSGANTLKKYKEKAITTPISVANSSSNSNPVAFVQQATGMLPSASDAKSKAVATTTTTTSMTVKKQQTNDMMSNELTLQRSTTATQTGATTVVAQPVNCNSNGKIRTPTVQTSSNVNVKGAATCNNSKASKSSANHKTGAGCGATAAGNSSNVNAVGTISTSTSSRPAVIILNDVHSANLSTDFTFGDFNEDELKFFDDDVDVEADEIGNATMSVKPSSSSTSTVGVMPSSSTSTSITTTTAAKQSPPAVNSRTTAYLNDSGASSDIVNSSIQQSDDMTFDSSANASSPNTSFAQSNNSSNNSNPSNVSGGIQLNDSGIYPTNTGSKTNRGNGNNKDIKSNKSREISHKLHVAANNSGNVDNYNVVPPVATNTTEDINNLQQTLGPQQVETCKNIETGLLAAARAALAKNNNTKLQIYGTQVQQQQQPYEVNVNSFSKSSSFSSTSSVSNDAKYVSPQSPTQITTNYQQQQQSHQNDYAHIVHSRSSSSSQRDVSPSQQHSLAISAQHKDGNIQFVQPKSMAFNLIQHENIVDFISSAWEEVTKVAELCEEQ